MLFLDYEAAQNVRDSYLILFMCLEQAFTSIWKLNIDNNRMPVWRFCYRYGRNYCAMLSLGWLDGK